MLVADATNHRTLEFHRFGPADYEHYRSIYATIEPISDLSLNNVLVWLDQDRSLEIAYYDDNAVLKYTSHLIGDDTYFSVVGLHSAEQTLKALFDYQKANNYTNGIVMAPQSLVDSLGSHFVNELEISQDQDNSDYMYDIALTHGPILRRSRKLRDGVKRFIKLYGDELLIKDLDLRNQTDYDLFREAVYYFRDNNITSHNDRAGAENPAIDRLLEERDRLDVSCLLVTVDGKVAGYATYHKPPHANYAMFNHVKCDYSYRFIYDFMWFCAWSNMATKGHLIVNGEQDLGLEGLRQYKSSLNPSGRLTRYNIRPKTETVS